jgi:hypothetical protein
LALKSENRYKIGYLDVLLFLHALDVGGISAASLCLDSDIQNSVKIKCSAKCLCFEIQFQELFT